jgi:hypothetical protein
MKRKAKDLIFISQIKRDGSGVKPVSNEYLEQLENNHVAYNQEYEIKHLSMTEGTYLAIGFNSYVVKLKDK